MPSTSETYISLSNLGKFKNMMESTVTGDEIIVSATEPSSAENGTSWIDADLTINNNNNNA